MHKVLLMVLWLLATGGLFVPESARQSLGLDEKLSAKAWSKLANVPIDEPVFAYISQGFEHHTQELETLGSNRKWEGTDRTVGQTLVASYLYNVRDIKYEAQGSPGPVPWAPNPGLMAETSSQTVFVIRLGDVERFSVDKFFDKLQPLAGRKIGELRVNSTPPGATIMLDGRRQGLTFRVSVETAGDHSISVRTSGGLLNCSKTITVPAGGTVAFQCPEN
jgi:PEGA domain